MTVVIPTTVNSTAAGFQSAFKPVTTKDRHACALAAVAILASTTLEDVWKKAEELGLPKAGRIISKPSTATFSLRCSHSIHGLRPSGRSAERLLNSLTVASRWLTTMPIGRLAATLFSIVQREATTQRLWNM